MSEPTLLSDFNGRARLFPLPNLVFFPHVMQPLHIFEPRYRQMTSDALADDRLIALVLPRPGWEKEYADRPAIHSVACIGRIMAQQQLDDGRYNILLRGITRIRIVEEKPTSKLYRIGRCRVLQERPITDEALAQQWRETLIEKSPSWFAAQSEVMEQMGKLLKSDLGLGTLCDIIAFALSLSADVKQNLLEELDVETRLTQLCEVLEAVKVVNESATRRFPPEFSVN